MVVRSFITAAFGGVASVLEVLEVLEVPIDSKISIIG